MAEYKMKNNTKKGATSPLLLALESALLWAMSQTFN